MGAPRTRPQVHRFFLEYGEGQYTVEEISSITNLAPEQVVRAIYTILRQNELPGLGVVVNQQVWQYRPSLVDQGAQISNKGRQKANKALPAEYEQVGVTTGGETIVRPKGGLELYLLKPLEI